MKCPDCGKECVLPAETVLEDLYQHYQACPKCPSTPGFRKTKPLPRRVWKEGACPQCGKRHLDLVMADILEILRQEGEKIETLRDVGTPLLSWGYPIPYPPRLGKEDLILVTDHATPRAAERIVNEITEVRGVIQRKGSPDKSVGIEDTRATPHVYKLLAGCDVRCDLAQTVFGELIIYKNQSQIHIEFRNQEKMRILDRLYSQGRLTGKKIVDGFAGPGTLGLLTVLAGARSVVLNDAWKPAVENILLNLEANKNILQLKKTSENPPEKLVATKPVMAGRWQNRDCEVTIYHGDFRELKGVIGEYDLCLVDTFPGVKPPLEGWEKNKIVTI